VLDTGPKFFLVGLIDERIRFNGFQCMRFSDVRRLKAPAPYAEFFVAALIKRGEVIKRKPSIELSNIAAILESANQIAPLITIHTQKTHPDICWIGRALGGTKSHVSLLEIGPDAVWETAPMEKALKAITRVDFLGGYEDALYSVGGNPPKLKLKTRRRRKSATARQLAQGTL
jgi:hypothetical protein